MTKPRKPPLPPRDPKTPPHPNADPAIQLPGEESPISTPDEVVDRESEDSFPASDPPSSTPMHAGKPTKQPVDTDAHEGKQPKPGSPRPR